MIYVIIPKGDGCKSHKNVNTENINLPNDAEIYDNEDSYLDRLSDFK